MLKAKHVVVMLTGLFIFLSSTSRTAHAQFFIGDDPPDLQACENNGWQNVLTGLFVPFTDEQSCLDYAALGGAFRTPNEPNDGEADFFVTNETGVDLHVPSILISSSHHADNITFGRNPSQYQTGTLPNPASNPNMPVNTVLKLKFDYYNNDSYVNWVIQYGTRGRYATLTISVRNDGTPGWNTVCNSGTGEIVCQIKDTVHMLLTLRPPTL
jgi:hypothetical protein